MLKTYKYIVFAGISFFLLTGFLSISTGKYHCLDKDEISNNELSEIIFFSNEAISDLRSKEYGKFIGKLDSNIFPDSAHGKIGGVVDNIEKRLETSSGISIQDVKLLEINGSMTQSIALCGSVDPSNSEYMEVAMPNGYSRLAYVFSQVNSQPIDYNLSFMLNLSNDEMEIVSFSITPRSVNGKDSKYYSSLAKKSDKINNYITASFSYSMASLLSSGSDFSRDFNSINIQKMYSKFYETKNVSNFDINNKTYEVVGLGVITTLSDISPHVKYVGKTKLIEGEVKKEASSILRNMLREEKEISKEFSVILFQSYEKKPIDKNKKYQYFRVPLFTDGRF